MQKEVHHIPWISVTLVLLAIATVGFFAQPDSGVTGALVYRDYGYGGYGGGFSGPAFFGDMSITAFYDQYHIYIDAIIFLLIFLSVGKALLLSHFGSGGKALYIAVGLALTLGLLLWEEQNNFSIIYQLGPVGVIALLLILFGGVYFGVLRVTDGSHFKAILVTLFIGYLVHRLFPDLISYLPDLVYSFFSPLASTDDFFGRVFFVGLIALLIWLFIKRSKIK